MSLPSLAARLALAVGAAAQLTACGGSDAKRATPSPGAADMKAMTGTVRIAYLHHSTGEIIWSGGTNRRVHRVWDRAVPEWLKRPAGAVWSPAGVPEFLRGWNAEHGTDYRIERLTYPATKAGYPWANYPYDYWNLWVAHRGEDRDRGELNLDDLVKDHDVIVFKHCFPVGRIGEDAGAPRVDSSEKTLENYKLQYAALKARLHELPDKRFIVWTGAALSRKSSTPEQAARARAFFDWVKGTWDEKGDNIFVWDLYELAADAQGFLAREHEKSPGDSHPNAAFARRVAPLIGRRIVDVIEGRGDAAGLTGLPADPLRGSTARAASR